LGEKTIVISADSLIAVLEEEAEMEEVAAAAALKFKHQQEHKQQQQQQQKQESPVDPLLLDDALAALSSSTLSEDDDNYWDDTWVADDNEAEERRKWLERERKREAKHRLREEKQRELDEIWARNEKLRCELRDRRVSTKEEGTKKSVSGVMARYGSKKNRTLIVLRNIVSTRVVSVPVKATETDDKSIHKRRGSDVGLSSICPLQEEEDETADLRRLLRQHSSCEIDLHSFKKN